MTFLYQALVEAARSVDGKVRIAELIGYVLYVQFVGLCCGWRWHAASRGWCGSW